MTPDINFETELWKAADKLRKKVEVHNYKYIVLTLIFLRYLSYVYEEEKKNLKNSLAKDKKGKYLKEIIQDKDFYLSKGILVIPKEASWEYIKSNANKTDIAAIIDNAIEILENEYPNKLENVIPIRFKNTNLDNHDIAYLIAIFSRIEFGDIKDKKDIFGRIYEYFLGKFAEVEGKKGGEFYTPRCITNLIVNILDIKEGKIFDPACGSGGFFISAAEKLERESIRTEKISIYGQDSKDVAWMLCKMNLIIHKLEGDIKIGDSYHEDKFWNMKFDYVVSNPPFNDSEWGSDRIKPDDPRFKYGIPPESNANYVWIQHYIYHLADTGKAGFVMANGALSVGGKESEIRKKLIEEDLIYGIIATPPKLFYNVTLPVSLWFLTKQKPKHMKHKILFIYAKNLYKQLSRKQNIFTEEHINKIVEKFRMFEKGENEEKINEIGFSKIATLQEVAKNGYVLTPGRYVGIKIDEKDEPFEEKMKKYSEELSKLLSEEKELTEKVKKVFKELGWEL